MDLSDSNRVNIFEIYWRFCDIRSGKAYVEENNGQDAEAQRSKFSRDSLAELLKYVELRVHRRNLIFDELLKLMWKLELTVDFSEFSRFYDFVFFMCRENGQKNITVNKAITAWRLVLAGRFRLLNQWCGFVQENQRHNISEDTWQQVLAFSRCVHENLEGYDPEGYDYSVMSVRDLSHKIIEVDVKIYDAFQCAWPVIIDDFVEHMYRVLGSNKDPNFFCRCGDSESQSCEFEDPLPGLKITPGLKRKLPSFQEDEMESSDTVPDFTNLNLALDSKRSRLITHDRPLNRGDDSPCNSAGDCMDIVKPNSPLGSTKSLCAVEGCLSKGFAGLFSTLFAT